MVGCGVVQFYFTAGGIPFEELGGSPTISVTQKKTTAKRMFRTNWSDWQAFSSEVIGGPGAGFFGFGSINDPTTFPGFDRMVVEDIDIEPFEPESPTGGVDVWTLTNAYDGGAKIIVSYESKDPGDDKDGKDKPEVPDGTFLTLNLDVGGEYQTIPGRTWKWFSDFEQLPADTNPGILIPTSEVVYNWERVPNPPWDNIRKATGCVSEFAFPSTGSRDKFKAGSLLFLGAKASRQFAMQTQLALWKLEYRFSERLLKSPVNNDFTVAGWNYYYRSNPAAPGGGLVIDKPVDAANNPAYMVLPYAFDDKFLGLFINGLNV